MISLLYWQLHCISLQVDHRPFSPVIKVKQQDNRESKWFAYHWVNLVPSINKVPKTPEYLLITKKRHDFDLNNKFTNSTLYSFDLVTCDVDRYVLTAYCYVLAFFYAIRSGDRVVPFESQ